MKDKNILVGFLLIVVAAVSCFLIYNKANKDSSESDAKKFSEEYKNVDKDNPFVYRSLDEVNKILENGTGIVYLGFPECPWCQKYVTFLNEAAKDYNIDKVYYANISEDRKNNTQSYKRTVSLLNDYLQYDEEGNKKVYVPSVIAVYKGEIVGFDDETAWDTKGFDSPDEYWNDENISLLKDRLGNMITDAKLNSCSECND